MINWKEIKEKKLKKFKEFKKWIDEERYLQVENFLFEKSDEFSLFCLDNFIEEIYEKEGKSELWKKYIKLRKEEEK